MIFKIKIEIEDLIEQIKNEGLIWRLTHFGVFFLLNETTCFVQNNVVSCIVHIIKKRERETRNGAVLNSIMLLLPLDGYKQGKKKFFSPATPLCLYLPTCLNPDITHTPSWPTTIIKREESHALRVTLWRLQRGRPNHLTLSHEPPAPIMAQGRVALSPFPL
jgi:hypothetical protein